MSTEVFSLLLSGASLAVAFFALFKVNKISNIISGQNQNVSGKGHTVAGRDNKI